jgi:TRAP-type C4-dicarboxylate transport system substrate-binding protein
MPTRNRTTAARPVALAALLPCLAAALAGCSLGGGSSKSGGSPAERGGASNVVTLRFASADSGAVARTFASELARVSGGRLRAVTVRYDDLATDVDQQIARDVARGRVDIADVAARAWESLGATGLRAFQSPFLITSDALLDRVVADRRIADPLLQSLTPLRVTGLSLTPRGVRYLFAADRPLDRPDAFKGARIRVNESPTTEDILSELGARPTTSVRSGRDVVAALRDGDLDAVEASMRLATASGYLQEAPHQSPALYAKVTTLVANSKRLEDLGPAAGAWIREAAARAAAAERAHDDRSSWVAACASGLRVAKPTPAQLDALQVTVVDTHTNLDADPVAAVAVDRIGLLATQTARVDPWAHCAGERAWSSPTRDIDGTYEVTITQADLDRTGTEPGNDGPYRLYIGNGRYALLHMVPDPTWPPGWDFNRDPVDVGTVRVEGDRAQFRNEKSILVGTAGAAIYRFELFRDRLRWRYVSGTEDFVVWSGRPWRKVD